MAATKMVHVRANEKEKAAETLAEMGLWVSDAVRTILVRVAALGERTSQIDPCL
jgi:antitoxin component of RelBE/YafQ-DinJ toxin-antitoxin module